MITISRRHILTLAVFSLCFFLLPHSYASAQSCTRADSSACTEGKKLCVIPQGSTLGTCETVSTQTFDPAANDTAGNTSGGVTLTNPLKVNSLEALLNLVLTAVIRIGTIILVLMLVWVGFLFVTARGNEEKIRDARRALVWTVIGGLILLGAKGISTVIESTANTLGS